MLFPDAQMKAQAELDAVVGHDRLPTMDDFTHLPYIRQTVKETLRCTKLSSQPPSPILVHPVTAIMIYIQTILTIRPRAAHRHQRRHPARQPLHRQHPGQRQQLHHSPGLDHCPQRLVRQQRRHAISQPTPFRTHASRSEPLPVRSRRGHRPSQP